MNRPNVFIVGAPKCGTSSLHDYLAQHPEIFMCRDIKEPDYFCTDLKVNQDWRSRSMEDYLRLFEKAGDVKRCGESSVWYLYSTVAAAKIKQFDPQARIIIMLRNPVDAMYSLHGQFIWSCNDDILDFEEALAAEAERRQGRCLPQRTPSPDALLYSQVFTFAPQVKRYFDVFGRPQVRVIIFEDFVKDTPGCYRKTLEFLEVDPSFQATLEVVNAAKPVPVGINRFLGNRPWLRAAIHKVVPAAVQRKVIDVLPYITPTLKRPNKIDPELKRRLQPQFREDIDQLSALLDRDLSKWYTPVGK